MCNIFQFLFHSFPFEFVNNVEVYVSPIAVRGQGPLSATQDVKVAFYLTGLSRDQVADVRSRLGNGSSELCRTDL